jgi:Domain of unknown function (DUF4263)
MPRILLACDDKGLSLPRLRELLVEDNLQELSEAKPSDGLGKELQEEGIEVAILSLEDTAQTLMRYAELDIFVDAIVVATIRPYKNRSIFLTQAAESVRRISEKTTYRNGIRINTLPIIIIDIIALLMPGIPLPKDIATMSAPAWSYIHPQGVTLTDCLLSALADWRVQLIQDLDFLGFGISYNEAGEVEVAPVVRKKKDSPFFDASATLTGLRQSGYLRLPQDWVRDLQPYVQLQQTLNRVQKLSPEKQEPELQSCLDQNPELIYRGIFQRHWSQLMLRHPDPLRGDIIPDFILATEPSGEPLWEVMEIKTSEKAIVNRGKFTSFFKKALEQLGLQYGDYFSNPRTSEEVQRRLGSVVRHPRKALLIGRKLDADDAQLLQESRAASDWNDIEIITYDDLFEVGARQIALRRRLDTQVLESQR